jgi:hypothetical protein
MMLRLNSLEANNVGYGPLYKMSADGLEAARQYIVGNLDKRFIEASKAPFASPILMAEKPSGGLRFCVDYPWVEMPDSIVSDRGGQFISEFWDEFCRILGIKKKLTSGHHPQTNGQVENMNQWIAQCLRPFISHYQDDWDELLPMLNLAAACLKHESIGISPFMVERGYEPRMSFDWDRATPAEHRAANEEEAQQMVERIQGAWEFAKKQMSAAQERMKRAADKKRREEDFQVGEEVFIIMDDWNLSRPNRKLSEQNARPYRILE